VLTGLCVDAQREAIKQSIGLAQAIESTAGAAKP
jgi:hypothetical protein